MNTILWY